MEEVELRRYWWILRKWLGFVLLLPIVCGAVAYVVSIRSTPVYTASATLLVYRTPSGDITDYNAIVTSERLARTYSTMIPRRPVLEAVIQRMGLNESPSSLAKRVRVSLIQDTQLIQLDVEDADPQRAADLANAIAEEFIRQNSALQEARFAESLENIKAQISELSGLMEQTQRQLDTLKESGSQADPAEAARLESILAGYRTTYSELVQTYEKMRLSAAQTMDSVTLFEWAQPPTFPVRPKPLNTAAVAATAGLVAAIALAFLVEYLDDTVKTPDEVRDSLGLGTLGAIPAMNGNGNKLIVADDPSSLVTEAFRKVRTNLWFASVDHPLHIIMVTSPSPMEGKSFIAANLAAAIAQSGKRVILVDADLRRPRLHRLFQVRPQSGLTQSLLDGNLQSHLLESPVENLLLLPAGPLPPNPTELLASQRMADALEELGRLADVVVVDTVPVLPLADSLVLAPKADGVVLVMEAGKTRRAAARQAVESLAHASANLVGAVLNRTPGRGSGYYYYYYYYYDDTYYNGDGQRRKERRRRRKEHRSSSISLPSTPGKGAAQ
ncbi:MAG: polysaccharide biosynthesis tyrosine autokinase [Anaerolineae bacterium]